MSDSARVSSGNLRATPADRLLTAKQVAILLAVSERTVWRLDSAGKLPRPVRLGGSVRWRSYETHLWMAAGDSAASSRVQLEAKKATGGHRSDRMLTASTC